MTMTAPHHPPRHRSSHHRAAEPARPVAPTETAASGRWEWNWTLGAHTWVLWGHHVEADPVTGAFSIVRDGFELVEVKRPGIARRLAKGMVVALTLALTVAAVVAFVVALIIGMVRNVANSVENEPVPGPTTTTVQ